MGTQNIHDSFAREILSYKENAVCFFRGILPEDVVKRLDFKSLTEDKTSYTDEELAAYFSDVVYECRYKGSFLKIALLFEHKSFVPQFPHFQLLRYILNIWESFRKQRKPVPIVLPIILYHGKQKWNPRPFQAYVSGDTDLFARFIPGFEYILVDLSTIPDKQIMALFNTNPAVKLWLLIQKYIYVEEALMNNLDGFFSPDIVYFTLEEGVRFFESIWRYIFEATHIEPDTILEKIPMLPDGAKEAIMTTAEKLRKQGRQEGKQEGLEEGEQRGEKKAKLEDARRMLEKGYPFEDICEITGLSRDEVKGVR
jgi:predicted transposase/invertase (TIGR01784 family)